MSNHRVSFGAVTFAIPTAVAALLLTTGSLRAGEALHSVSRDTLFGSFLESPDLDLTPVAETTPAPGTAGLEFDVSMGVLQDIAPASPDYATAHAMTSDTGGDTYVGGRGLITVEGPAGMFLNPTSGTMQEGHFTAQYCTAFLRQGGDTTVGHGALLAYGVTDWLEAGAVGLLVDVGGVNHNIGSGGPFVRVRLLKDESWWPEVSVGGISRFGYRVLRRHTLFVAASKRFPLDEAGFCRSFRLHLGFRQLWQDSDVNEANGSIGYVGGEIELPHDLYLVAEVSNKDDVFAHTPFSVGLQLRSPRLAFSVAGIQTGSEDQLSLYAGIGIDY